MKVIVYVDPSRGTTAIVHPAPQAQLEDESEQEFLDRVAARAVPSGVPYQIVDRDPILDGDRTFRNALTCVGGKFAHDMAKAREIHMAAIRKARDKELAKLDVETVKALGSGDTARRDAVEAQKQALRDIPKTFDLSSAKTCAALKAMWPAEIQKKAP